jgi:Peptidase M50B-like
MGMSINPTTGGCTRVHGGHPPSILCSGYVGSSVLGGLFILGGFDTLVAKLLSFVAGVGLLAPLSLVRDKLYVLHRLAVSPMRVDTRIEPFCSP